MRWLLFVLCLTCTRTGVVRQPTRPTAQLPKAIVRLDLSGLKPPERAIVQRAMQAWEAETNGCIVTMEGGGIRVLPKTWPQDPTDYHTIGLYTPWEALVEIDFTSADPEMVAKHEIGHVLGMNHVDATRALMHPKPRVKTLAPEDRAQLGMATGCILPSNEKNF